MTVRRLRVIALSLGAGLLLTIGLQGALAHEVPASHPADPGGSGSPTLHLNFSPTDPTIDPSLVASTHELFLVHQMFEGLFRVDDRSGEVLPELATSWDLSPSGTALTVTLRSDAVWSDGHTLTAADVRYGILRSLDPATGGSQYFLLFPIQNAYEYWSGSISDPNLVGVTVLDSTHMRFDLTGPTAHLPAILASPAAKALPQWAITANPASWTEPGNIVTSGPYHLTGWTPGTSMTLSKAPWYYDQAHVQIGTVALSMWDEATAWSQYEAGHLDTVRVPIPEWNTWLTDPLRRQELHAAPVECTYYYGINTQKPPLDSPLVRQALIAAVDRTEMVNNFIDYASAPARTYTPRGVFGHVDGLAEGVGLPFNPSLAQTLLAAAGYPNGQGLPPITLAFNAGSSHLIIANALQQEWIDNLGVTVQLAEYSWPDYLNLLNTDPPHFWRMSWCADYPDAYSFLYETIISQSQRYGNWSNATYQNLLNQVAQTADAATRRALYQQAEEILVETDAIQMPLYHYGTGLATQAHLERSHGVVHRGRIADWRITRVSASIGAGGGSLTSYDGSTTITLPAGAVTDTLEIVQAPAYAIPPGGNLTGTGHLFEISAVYSSTGQTASLAPGETYTLTVTYNDAEVGPAIEATLALYYWDGAQWIQEPSTLDTGSDSLIATPDHFSVWAVLGETNRLFLPAMRR